MSLESLPRDLITHISFFLSIEDIARLTRINRLFSQLFQSDVLWKHLCNKYFASLRKEHFDKHLSWKQIFKKRMLFRFETTTQNVILDPRRQSFKVAVTNRDTLLRVDTPLEYDKEYRWEFEVSWLEETYWDRLIGAVSFDCSRDFVGYLGHNSKSWGFFNASGKNGAKNASQHASPYTQGFNSGDRVGALLRNGVLSFTVNGVDQGPAFKISEDNFPLFAAMYVYRLEDSVEIVHFEEHGN